MDEAEKGIWMATAIFGFVLGVLLAGSILGQVTRLQECIYRKGTWNRNVVVVTQVEGREYG